LHACCRYSLLRSETILTEAVCLLEQIRAAIKKQSSGKYTAKVKARGRRREHVAAHPIPKDELGDVFK
jgi:hypothetical protein